MLRLLGKKFKKKRTLIISQDYLRVLEEGEEVIFTKREYLFYNEDVKKIKKYITKREIDIIVEEDNFIYTEKIDKEKSEYIDIKAYIENEVLTKLSGEKSDYYYKYYLSPDGEYDIYIGEEEGIRNLVQVGLRYGIRAENFYISSDKKYIIEDFQNLINLNKKKKPLKLWGVAAGGLFLFFCFNFIYIKKIEKEISDIKIIRSEQLEVLKGEKSKLVKLEEEGNVIRREVKLRGRADKKFRDEILWIVNLTPGSVRVKTAYWEKNRLTLDGSTDNLEELFKFIKVLEADKKVEDLVFDYVLKNMEEYTYVLEIRVN